MSDMDQYREIFMSESADFLQAITDGLLALESDPADLEPIEVIFRGAHSLKGMSAAMGYDRTADLTHTMESLMDRVRHHERAIDAALIDLMLEATDAVRALIERESSGSGDLDVSALVERLVASTSASEPAPDDAGPSAESAAESSDDVSPQVLNASVAAGECVLSVGVLLDEACVLKAVRAYMVIKRLSHMGTVVETIPSGAEIEDERFDRQFTVILSSSATADAIDKAVLGVSEVESVAITPVVPCEPTAGETAHEEGDVKPAQRGRTTIPKLAETQTVRIAIGHLDTMVDLVGEIVILRSRLQRIAGVVASRDLDETLEDLDRIAGELQHEVMHTRMVPVGNIFNRFPRMVRDLARDLGKDVGFEMDGLDIELDRTVLDEIGDPIVHLLRNSLDHGLEPPDARELAGKPRRGIVTLRAVRERDLVRISVSDDGGGIDIDRVWDKACSMGLVEKEGRALYRDEDVLMLTCVPGFSTAVKATKVSGRGVGMDAVKGKIEHLGGSMSIRSTRGVGTEVELMLPLTLAIIQALMVEAGGEGYAVPLSSVDEVLSVDTVVVDTIDGAPVVIMRDSAVVPVFRLESVFAGEDVRERPPAPHEHLVLLSDGLGQQKALVVDGLLGRHEIVVKPLARMFRDVAGLSGATVLGDGRVALILDPRSLFPVREETER